LGMAVSRAVEMFNGTTRLSGVLNSLSRIAGDPLGQFFDKSLFS
jgi:hypothetical protein